MASFTRIFGPKRFVAIDVSSRIVRLAEFQNVDGKPKMLDYVEREVDREQYYSAGLEQRSAMIRDFAIGMLRGIDLTNAKVGFVLDGNAVFIRTRHLSPVKKLQVSRIVRYEVQQQIPFALDEILWDYEVLSQSIVGYDVLMAAIRADVLNSEIGGIVAQRRIACVDAIPFAIYNRLAYDGFDSEKHVVYVYVGDEKTNLVFVYKGQFKMTRSLKIGENDFVVEEIRESNSQRLKNELLRTYGFYRSKPGGGSIDEIRVLAQNDSGSVFRLFPETFDGEIFKAQRHAFGSLFTSIFPVYCSDYETAAVIGLGLRMCNESELFERTGSPCLKINLKARKLK